MSNDVEACVPTDRYVVVACMSNVFPLTVKFVSDSPVPCPWVKERSGKVEVAVVEVAVTVPAVKRPIELDPTVDSENWSTVEVAPEANPP